MLREGDAQDVRRGAPSECTSQQVPHVPCPFRDGPRESPSRSQASQKWAERGKEWAMGIIAGDYKREFSFRVYHLSSPAKEISKFGASG